MTETSMTVYLAGAINREMLRYGMTVAGAGVFVR